MSARCRIAICICTYDRYDLLPAAIDSALSQTLKREAWRVVVVDNSPDSARAAAEAHKHRRHKRLDYVVERKAGLSNARNVGARACNADVIAYMDDDALAAPDWLERLLDGFASATGVGAVGGKVEPIWPVPPPPWLSPKMVGALSVVDWGGALRALGAREWLAGTNVAFDVAKLLSVGGFQTALGRVGGGLSLLSNEESAVIEAFQAMNTPVLYAPDATVRHLVDERRLSQAWFRKRAAWQAASDFVKDPAAVDARSGRAWDAVLDHFGQLPPAARSPRGFFVETEDPGEFQRQLDSIYNMTVALLAGRNLDLAPCHESAVR